MGVNEYSGMSLSGSPMIRRAAGSSGVVALASGDAGGTGQPRDGDGGGPGTQARRRSRSHNGLIKADNGLIKARAADPCRRSPMPGGCGDDRGRGGAARVTADGDRAVARSRSGMPRSESAARGSPLMAGGKDTLSPPAGFLNIWQPTSPVPRVGFEPTLHGV